MHKKQQHHKFAKAKRPADDPVANPPKGHVQFLPLPERQVNSNNLRLDLETVLPGITEEVKRSGKLVFHVIGDTGGIHGTETQEAIATALERQIEEAAQGERPRFLYHLGDVVYFNGQPEDYPTQFYEPYKHLDYPIFAVPGNHDCGGDPKLWSHDGPNQGTRHPLSGFLDNFCSSRAVHLYKHRTAMTQPGSYWTLTTPFFNIIGLNSNIDGLLDAPGTSTQLDWFHSEAANNLAVPYLVAVHHPPYSLDTNHGGYGVIGEALEPLVSKSNRLRGVFTGHVHNYQRFMQHRPSTVYPLPYVIAGAGGYANSARAIHRLPKEIDGVPYRTSIEGLSLEYFDDSNPGFVRVTYENHQFTGEYFAVPFGTEKGQLADTWEF